MLTNKIKKFLKMKNTNLVVTISGNECPKSLCRKIKNEYYFIGDKNIKDSGDVYFVNNKYYKENTGYIKFDHRLHEYVIAKSNELVTGVVGYENKKFIFGEFSSRDSRFIEYAKIYIENDTSYYLFDSNYIKDSNYKENLQDHMFYERNSISAQKFITPIKCRNDIKRNLNYDAKNNLNNAVKLYRELYTDKPSRTAKEIAAYLQGLTFGVEFETSIGAVPRYVTDKLGLIPLRDGSIGGLEFATIPLEGEKGVQTLLDSIDALALRTKYDDGCSLHVHLGNLPRTEEFFLAMFKVLCIIQDEVFAMFPIYKKENHGIKNKCYTKPFNLVQTLHRLDSVITSQKQIKTNFSKLYKYLSMGQNYSEMGSNLNNVNSHPSDPGGNGKWNIRTRYHWCNLIPLLFGNKQTIEFRIHTATYNKDKLAQYLILIASITNYVKNNISDILKNENLLELSLYDTYSTEMFRINKNRKNTIDYMSDYIRNRKNYISNCIRNNDILADEDNLNYKCAWFNFTDSSNKSIKYATSYKLRSKKDNRPSRYIAFDNDVRVDNNNPLRRNIRQIQRQRDELIGALLRADTPVDEVLRRVDERYPLPG